MRVLVNLHSFLQLFWYMCILHNEKSLYIISLLKVLRISRQKGDENYNYNIIGIFLIINLLKVLIN